MFGKKKQTDEARSSAKIQKSKSFKRIRGFLRGDSKKKAAAKQAAASATAAGDRKAAANKSSSRSISDDASTIYGVDVDDRSVVSRPVEGADSTSPNAAASNSLLPTAAVAKKKTYMLKVVLMLMDPKTRRFELLQLEFDSLKALVSDVLAQIPLSVTEDVLRKQTYTGICGADGKEMPVTTLLSIFCKGNEVLVAIPTGVSAAESARLAKPILRDDKVVAMLSSSGIDTTIWREKKAPSTKSKSLSEPTEAPTTEAAPEAAPMPAGEKKSSSSSSAVTYIFVAIAFAMILQVFHIYISAPIKPGHVVAPGIYLTKCGLLSVMPRACADNAFFTLDKATGTVTVRNAHQEVAWEMHGGVCPSVAADDTAAPACEPGMEVQEDGTVVIGGQKVSFVTRYMKDTELSPWPFAETPKLKIKNKF